MPLSLGLRPLGFGIYIRQIPLAYVITITYIPVVRDISFTTGLYVCKMFPGKFF